MNGQTLPSADTGVSPYRVLARKYRPQTFEDGFIGQQAMKRTLENAFAAGRIAHAFMLTGVRGVGKTTTARIIAKALNCIGPDGKRTEPTVKPCGECEPCRSIAESRNVDVYEMDAASRTGIDDIREIVEGVRPMFSSLIKEHIELSFSLAPDLWDVKVDAVQMEQVLTNLAINARDAMPGGGKLMFETRNVSVEPDDELPVPDILPGDYATLSVTDTAAYDPGF